MLTKATLLNFLITVVIGSVLLGVVLAVKEGGEDPEAFLAFSAVACMISGLIGAPTLIIQLIYVNLNRTKDIPVTDRLRKQGVIHLACGALTFAILGLISFDWFYGTALLLAYGVPAFVAASISNRKVAQKHPLVNASMEDVLDSSFDYI